MNNWSSSWSNPVIEKVQILSIKDNGGAYQNVECWIVGNLAVHKAINVDEKGWRVTHVPTLAKCNDIVPYGLHTREVLMNWCKKVQELYPEDWTVLDKLDESTYNIDTEEVWEAKERLIENCKKVKVE